VRGGREEERKREEERIRGSVKLPATSKNSCHIVAKPGWFRLEGYGGNLHRFVSSLVQMSGFIVSSRKSDDRDN
jgi:hypothetical protein